MTKLHARDARRPQLAHPARPCRPRSAGAARLRQYAGLSRLDRALSDTSTTLDAPRRPLHLRHARARRPPRRWRRPGPEIAGAAGTRRCCPRASPRSRWRCSRCSRPATTCWSPTAPIGRPAHFCDSMLKRFGVETTYYDPLIGAGIADAVAAEHHAPCSSRRRARRASRCRTSRPSPRSRTRARRLRPHGQYLGDAAVFPAAREAASTSRSRPAPNIIGGHSDLLLGLVSANERYWPAPARDLRPHSPCCAGPEDVFLALRGLRTMALRLREARAAGARDGALARERGRKCCGCCTRPCPAHPGPRDLEARLLGRVGPVLGRPEAGAPRRRSLPCWTAWRCSAWALPGAASRAS